FLKGKSATEQENFVRQVIRSPKKVPHMIGKEAHHEEIRCSLCLDKRADFQSDRMIWQKIS
ncbi:MAG: hypothetical protein OWS74_08480, partial [Firmicutes bacterium]|nr:hypothetical protein [Bacillota bacterium]